MALDAEQRAKLLRSATIAAAVTAGVVLRVYGLFTDFWLDEIWGLRIARTAPSAIDLITRIHVDTNHPLVLLWMRAMGPQVDWEWYRLPSLLAGIGTMLLLIHVARARVVMAIFASLCLPLVVYSSEARGYAAAAFLLVVALVIRAQRRLWADLSFGVAVILALLAHIGASTVYVGFLAADLVRGDIRRHVLPLLGAAALYAIKIRHLVIIGAPRSDAITSAMRALTDIAGVTANNTPSMLLAIAVAAIMLYEIMRRALARDIDAIFYGVALFIAPAAAAAATARRCACVAPRYFFFSVPFALLLLASFTARFRKGVTTVLVIAFLAGSVTGLAPFLRFGRGAYLDAFTDISRSAAVTSVGSTNDFRTTMLLSFYEPYLPEGHRIVYVRREALRVTPPDWILLESTETSPDALPRFGPYQLERSYPYGGFSGWTWSAYRRP